MSDGMAYVPPDRRKEGIIVMMDITQNTVMANLRAYEKAGVLQNKKIYEKVEEHVENLQIKERDLQNDR